MTNHRGEIPSKNAPNTSAIIPPSATDDANQNPRGSSCFIDIPDFRSESVAAPLDGETAAAVVPQPVAAAVTFTEAMRALSRESLLKELSYEKEIGEFRWLISRGKARAGALAGTINSRGYRMIKIMNHWYSAHRLVWFVERGSWPVKFIDHIDGNPLNNVIGNLREATNLQNQGNAIHHGYVVYNSKSGPRYHARIRINGKSKWLGAFSTAEAATAAYRAAHEGHFGEFSATRRSEVLSNAELHDGSSFLRRARPAHDAIEPERGGGVIPLTRANNVATGANEC